MIATFNDTMRAALAGDVGEPEEEPASEKPARARYDSVNGRWPENLPPLEPEEAIRAAKRLYRFAMKRKWRGGWASTSGRRYTWPRNGVFRVNHTGRSRGGWRDLVHDLSHYCHRQLYPKARPHDIRHEIIERELVQYVIDSGWLDGRLKRKRNPPPTTTEKRAEKLAHARGMLAKSLTRLKRATTIAKKWKAKVKRLERSTT